MKTMLETPHCTVTEEVASERFVENLLHTNTHNRTLSRHRVDQLVRDIKTGGWKFNGATIVIDGDGFLRDGQHRLTAIKEAGYPPVPLLVVRLSGTAEDAEPAYLTMDTGRSRSYADNLTHGGVKNGHTVGAICRMLYSVLNGGWNPTRAELESIRLEYGKEIEAVLKVRYETGMIDFQASYLAAFVAVAHFTGRTDEVVEFAKRVRVGEGLRRGTNAYLLFARANAAARLHVTRPVQMENFGRTVRITLAELSGRTFKPTGISEPYSSSVVLELLRKAA